MRRYAFFGFLIFYEYNKIAYLDGFSPNVQEILEKFKFRNQLDTMVDVDILGAVIEKFMSPTINLSPLDIPDDSGSVRIPALDNHTMDVIFEELIRRFNEENNEEAGEHSTPILRTSDGQLLFLLNNVSKMKETTEIGSRIAEVHNGSSLFTGDAQGDSIYYPDIDKQENA